MLKVLFAVLIVIFLFGAVFGFYFFQLAINRNASKKSALRALPRLEKKADAKASFFESVKYEDRYIESFDGLNLHALFIDNNSDRWAIVQHGYMSRAKLMGKTAKFFYSEGFNVLVPDARAHGESEGKYIGMGWHDRLDVMSWAKRISAERPNSEILLYGISMGASAMMMLAGENLPSQVKGIIEDCGFSSVWDECLYQLTRIFHLPTVLAKYILLWSNLYVQLFAKYDIRDANALESLKSARLPMIFIHGCNDSFVPFKMLDTVYQAAGASYKCKYAFPNAEHSLSSVTDNGRYNSILKEFIEKVFSQDSSSPIGQ